MKTITIIIFAVLAIIILFLPTVLLIVASFKLPRAVKHSSVVLMVIGAVLLSIASLDFLLTFFTALKYNSKELAMYAIHASYIVGALRYIGMLCLGIGLFRLTSVIDRVKA